MLQPAKARARVQEAEWAGLVTAITAGDQRALQVLYDRMHRVVYTLSVRITSKRETAEEVTLDVFHDVWRRASQYDPASGPVVAWIMNLTRSRAIDRLRFEQRKKRSGLQAAGPVAAVLDKDPHEDLHLRDEGRFLQEAIARLTAGERQAIETAFFSELTYAETAARLKEPIGTIKGRVRSGLKKLREALGGRASGT